MNKKIASEIADDALNQLMSGDKTEVKTRITNLLTEPEHDFVTKNEIEYQVKMTAAYHNEQNKIVRVRVKVNDQKFFSTLMPLTRNIYVNERSGEKTSKDIDKKIAAEIGDDALQQVMSGDKAEVKKRIINLLTESEYYRTTKNRIEYQVRVHAFYDDGRRINAVRKKKIIRVCSQVDDYGWTTFAPFCRDILVDEDTVAEIDYEQTDI